jgi:hypothetical protein
MVRVVLVVVRRRLTGVRRVNLVRLVDCFRLEPPRLPRRWRLGPVLEVLEQLTKSWPVPSKLGGAIVQELHELVGLERALLGLGFQIFALAPRLSQFDYQPVDVSVQGLHLFEVVRRETPEASFQNISFFGRCKPDRVDLFLTVIVQELNVVLELGIKVGQVHRPVDRAVSSPVGVGVYLPVADEQTQETRDRVEYARGQTLGRELAQK